MTCGACWTSFIRGQVSSLNRIQIHLLTKYAELLIIGSGAAAYMLSRKDRERLTKLGITMEAMDTNTAASYFNLLAQERPRQVAAALLVGGFGKKRR